MTSYTRIIHHQYQRPQRQLWMEHQRMLKGSMGEMVFERKPVRRSLHSRTVTRQPQRVWMTTKQICGYLRCCLRHVYWLTLNRRLPYHHYWSRSGPRYIFITAEVDAWLRRYRGKGRQLRRRRLQFGTIPRASWLNQKGTWKHA